MKRTKNVMAAIALTTCSAVLLTGCEKKEAISASDFISQMEEDGLSVQECTQDAIDNGGDASIISEGQLAVDAYGNFQIEFYQVVSEDVAEQMFELNKQSIIDDAEGESGISTKSLEMSNYARYTSNDGDMYYFIEYVDDTLVYAKADSDYKEDCVEELEAIGY